MLVPAGLDHEVPEAHLTSSRTGSAGMSNACGEIKGHFECCRAFTFKSLQKVWDLSPSWEGALLVAFGYTAPE